MSNFDAFDPTAGRPPYSLANKAERVIWRISWLLLARWTPPPLHAWRRLILRLFGARIGSGTRIYSSAKIWLPRNLQIGEHCLVGPDVTIYNQGTITAGDRCVISQHAHLCASTHDICDPAFALQERPIILENACWVASGAFVGPGVIMREGSVLSADGALFENAERAGVYRGNPAELIKLRTLNDWD